MTSIPNGNRDLYIPATACTNESPRDRHSCLVRPAVKNFK